MCDFYLRMELYVHINTCTYTQKISSPESLYNEGIDFQRRHKNYKNLFQLIFNSVIVYKD